MELEKNITIVDQKVCTVHEYTNSVVVSLLNMVGDIKRNQKLMTDDFCRNISEGYRLQSMKFDDLQRDMDGLKRNIFKIQEQMNNIHALVLKIKDVPATQKPKVVTVFKRDPDLLTMKESARYLRMSYTKFMVVYQLKKIPFVKKMLKNGGSRQNYMFRKNEIELVAKELGIKPDIEFYSKIDFSQQQ